MNMLIIELAKKAQQEEEEARQAAGERARIKCGICESTDFIAYIYHCLVCEGEPPMRICSTCFENRKSNSRHASSHPVVRYDEDFDGRLFGVPFTSSTINLRSLEREFGAETHANLRCNVCAAEPIRGLRFKCDACHDYDVCMECYQRRRATMKHSPDHPMIVIGKTESLEIDASEVELLGRPLGSGAFGTVYRANYKTQNKIVACKVIKYDVLKMLMGFAPDDLVNSFIRELNAFKEVKVRP